MQTWFLFIYLWGSHAKHSYVIDRNNILPRRYCVLYANALVLLYSNSIYTFCYIKSCWAYGCIWIWHNTAVSAHTKRKCIQIVCQCHVRCCINICVSVVNHSQVYRYLYGIELRLYYPFRYIEEIDAYRCIDLNHISEPIWLYWNNIHTYGILVI